MSSDKQATLDNLHKQPKDTFTKHDQAVQLFIENTAFRALTLTIVSEISSGRIDFDHLDALVIAVQDQFDPH